MTARTTPGGVRETLRDVLAAFGLLADEIRDIRTGRINKHWRVTAGGRQYALRRYNARAMAPSIAYEHAMLAHLDGRGWPVAAAIASREGETTVERGGRLWSLFPFLEGRPSPYNNARYLHIKGRLLARLHADMASAPIEGQRPGFSRVWELDVDPEDGRTPEGFPPAGGAARPRFPPFNDLLRAFGTEYRQEASVMRAHRYACLRELSRLGYGELPETFVHCDYHHDNLLFKDGALSGLLDFDLLHRDARVVDIAWAIVLDCLEPPAHNAISPQSVEAFVGGYQEASPLGEEERALIVPLIRAALIAGAAMRLRQWESGPKRLREHAPRSVRRTVEHRLPAFEARRRELEAAVVSARAG